jgi:hypothetical protein
MEYVILAFGSNGDNNGQIVALRQDLSVPLGLAARGAHHF